MMVLTVATVGCTSDDDGLGDAPPTSPPPPATDDRSDPATTEPDTTTPEPRGEVATLVAVAEACDRDGAVTVEADIVDSASDVDLGDCTIHLGPGMVVELSDLSISGGDVTIRGIDDDPSDAQITLERLDLDVDSLVITLDHPDAALRTRSIAITARDGLDLRLGAEDDGGTVHLIETSITTTGDDAPVTLLASPATGTVRLERSSIDATGAVSVSAADCAVEPADAPEAC